MNGCNACLKMKPDKFFVIKDKFSCNKNKDTFNLKRFAIMQNNKRASSFYIGNLLFLILVLLLCTPACVSSKVYEWRDTKGTEHYSDKLHPEAKIVDIKPGYSFFTVKKVYDGDTIELHDGTKVRFLGINTPEVQHRDKLGQAGGEEAKNWLINKLDNTKVRLEYDVEKKDKYRRTLAYVFTEKGEHVNLSLVEAGLATISIYPPNLKYVNELVAAENKAEQDKIGIWSLPEYTVIPVNKLTPAGNSGWTRVAGKIIDIRSSHKFIYLGFSNQFESRIERKWLALFPNIDSYLNKTVEVRGWLNRQQKHFSVLIRHPSAIRELQQ